MTVKEFHIMNIMKIRPRDHCRIQFIWYNSWFCGLSISARLITDCTALLHHCCPDSWTNSLKCWKCASACLDKCPGIMVFYIIWWITTAMIDRRCTQTSLSNEMQRRSDFWRRCCAQQMCQANNEEFRNIRCNPINLISLYLQNCNCVL